MMAIFTWPAFHPASPGQHTYTQCLLHGLNDPDLDPPLLVTVVIAT